jgi:hypothetical protein
VSSGSRRGRLPRAAGLAVAAFLALLPLLGAPAGAAGLPGHGNPVLGAYAGPELVALGVTLTAAPAAGYAPLDVQFRANVTGEGPGTLSVQWSFGDGTFVSGGLNISHRYDGSGRFVATVSVTDASGDRGNASLPVYTVAPMEPPQGLDMVDSLGLVAAGAGFGGLAAFAVYRVIERRRPPPREEGPEEIQALTDSPPDGAVLGVEAASAPSVALAAPPSKPAEEQQAPPLSDPDPSPLATRRRASDEILLHLGSLGRPSPDEVGDPSRTQGGMSERLGMPQNVVSPILRRLAAARVVTFEVRHVRNGRRRLKVYRLTDRGEAIVRELRAHR